LPVPGLDGSCLLLYFLKGEARKTFHAMERYTTLIFVGLIVFAGGFFASAIGFLAYPTLDFIFWAVGLS